MQGKCGIAVSGIVVSCQKSSHQPSAVSRQGIGCQLSVVRIRILRIFRIIDVIGLTDGNLYVLTVD